MTSSRSVILVREQEGHLTGGGGCGCLPEDVLRSHTEPAFQSLSESYWTSPPTNISGVNA